MKKSRFLDIKGDMYDLSSFFYQSYGELLGYAIKRTGNLHDAEDLIQDVFERLLNVDITDVKNLRALAFTAIQNRFLDTRKKASRKYEINDSAGGDIFISTFIVENNDIIRLDYEDEDEKKFDQLKDCIKNLKADQKFLINKFYFEKLSYKDIEGKYKETLETKSVKSGIQSAKRNLRICMERKSENNG
ncbi:MAG: RNA polymerase sigma factor [Mangrovibacterium sp.]